MTQYWLLKTEPGEFSIDDLARKKRAFWDGVRNYQARNFLKDHMKSDDFVFIYHSSAKPSGIAGLARVTRTGLPDSSAWDPKSQYYDPKSSTKNPVWVTAEVEFLEKFSHFVGLEEIKKYKDKLKGLRLIKRGTRLSVQPVSHEHFHFLLTLGRQNDIRS